MLDLEKVISAIQSAGFRLTPQRRAILDYLASTDVHEYGKILAEGTLEELTRRLGEGDLVTVRGSFDPDSVRRRLDGIEGVQIVDAEPGRARPYAGNRVPRLRVEETLPLYRGLAAATTAGLVQSATTPANSQSGRHQARPRPDCYRRIGK